MKMIYNCCHRAYALCVGGVLVISLYINDEYKSFLQNIS